MDEWTLNDLLECSVCLERLDTSSKVLPCQHTFCRKCLEEIVSTHKELRCPECRILVDAQIDDLPPNVLLMRILEGMKNSGNPLPQKKKPASFQKQQGVGINCPQGPAISPPTTHNLIENSKVPPIQKQNTQPTQPFARAIYDYVSKGAGYLSFRKGDVILLHRKVDAHWAEGECEGKTGIFPLSFVQVIIPLPNQVATCRALYDFRMVNDEEEGCLSFKKDEIITVIRRVDENWAEGKLNDHIGIFPLAFVEMNNVAQALMKLSINGQPGPSRIAPPTPNAEESTPLIPTDHSAVVSNPVNLNSTNQYTGPHDGLDNWGTTRPLVSRRSCAFNSGSTVSSSTTSTPTSSVTSSNSSSNTSSNSNSAPSSPPTSQPPQTNPNPFLTTSQTILQTSHITNSSHEVLPTTHIVAQQSGVGPDTFVDTHCLWAPTQPGEPSNLGQHPKEKRHSFSAVTPCLQSKHSNEGVNSDAASDSQNGQLNRHGSQRHRRSGSDLSSGANLPAGYLALYPYKPQKADELELKKGGLYLVTERCQDGWFKGTSYKTQKSGVFPGNYVTLAKSVGVVPTFRVRDGRGTAGPTQTPLQKTVHQQKTMKFAQMYGQLVPPELPPRASSPSARPQRTSFHSTSTSWQSASNDVVNIPKNVGESTAASQPVGASTAASSNGKPQSSAYGSLAVNPASTPTKSAEKVKEKKEKSGLIKRLTAMKRSKSPTEPASYSMDNPVFDDAPAGSHQVQAYGHGHTHPVHLRSGSCPSQLIAVKPNSEGGNSNVKIISASVSARLKHKERPTISNVHFVPGSSRPLESNTVAKVAMTTGSSHRKSNSLDAGDARKPKQLVPPVRERFRCIVPYPPNSEYELELKVGDIIYVHRKREDGWYKGTQQRTGRTGLFPASFVETY